jgi:5S rRNA maturation endonuclease (ribonuclease M5)
MAPCPAHEDRNPSLSIREIDGKVLLHCHAGCSQRDVIEALKGRGLWESTSRKFGEKMGRIVTEYNYTDAAGNLLYQVVRFEPKDFRPRYPDGRGGWIWKKHPRQVLYRLPEVLESAICFVVEGEKDVESLRERGFVATTNAGGAKSPWLQQFTEALAGREVNIIPDNDQPGWERVKVIARALLGHAARIRVLDLPRETKDISDWFAAGHSECELIAMLEGVYAV